MSPKIRRAPDVTPVVESGLVTVSREMLKVFELCRRVARTNATVLVRGETGTGKDGIAKMVHSHSGRAGGPFRAVNCATFTPELLASTLFGHVRGAFTGAIRDRHGLFRLAHGGTLFLDEVAELPLELQARLLRVLQERRFVPVGGTEEIESDIRLVSATHRALRQEVQQHRFREDLMFRVRVVPIYLPRLADRDGDIEVLLWHFIRRFNAEGYRSVAAVDSVAFDALMTYAWPGNVRELRNCVEHAFAIGEGDVITVDELPPELRGETQPATASIEEIERERVFKALRTAGGKRGEAAKLLGMSRSTLWRKLREWGH